MRYSQASGQEADRNMVSMLKLAIRFEGYFSRRTISPIDEEETIRPTLLKKQGRFYGGSWLNMVQLPRLT